MAKESAVHTRNIFYAGKVFFREGDRPTVFYLIESGKVGIVKKGPNGQEIKLGVIGKNAVFGEMALIDPAPRMATAIALEDTVCIAIRPDQLQKRLRESPKELMERYRWMIDYIRGTLPYADRPPELRKLGETDQDAAIREMVENPNYMEMLETKDPVLRAIFDCFRVYCVRRLPPKSED